MTRAVSTTRRAICAIGGRRRTSRIFRRAPPASKSSSTASPSPDDLHENGKLVLGESIADLGGLTIAHMAFQRELAAKPAPKMVNGFTQEQLFFLGFARIWGTSARPEYERMTVTVDPHPLPRFRVDGPLSNMPEFQAAFSCQASDPMVRPADARCKIW
jgi:putative endopeptidase